MKLLRVEGITSSVYGPCLKEIILVFLWNLIDFCRTKIELESNCSLFGSVSRKEHFPIEHFFDWTPLGLLLIVCRLERFYIFVLFLEAAGVMEYCCMAVKRRLEALCFVRFRRATCYTRDEPSSKRVGGIEVGPNPSKLRSWRCTQPRAAKAAASLAVVAKMSSIPRAAANCYRMIHTAGGRD